MLWTKGVETGRLTPNEFVAVTSTNIAQILNIYPQKGAILPGADADIVVLGSEAVEDDLGREPEVDHRLQRLRGLQVNGQARYTLSRGEVVWADGHNSQPQPGRGKYIPRPAFSAPHKALSTWKELTAPRKIERDPANIPSGV